MFSRALSLVLLFAPLYSVFAQVIDEASIYEPYRTLFREAQRRVQEFPELPVSTAAGAHKIVDFALDDGPLIKVGDERYAGVRFTVPAHASLDMVWAFDVPEAWSHWSIIPAKGPVTRGFSRWINAERLFSEFTTTLEHPLRLQTLESQALVPGAQYILWFHRTLPGSGKSQGRATIGFHPAPKDGRWDSNNISAALGLRSAPAAQQAKYLKSRGLKILLDDRLFDRGYGEARTENVLWSRQRATRTSDGFFIETKMSIPPSSKTPLLSEIESAYGAPDLVLSPKEQKVLAPGDESHSTVYYYDYIALYTEAGKGGDRVVNVVTQGNSMASVAAQQDGWTWSESDAPELPLRIFYQDRKEVARMAFWSRPEAKLLSGALLPGKYTREEKGAGVREAITVSLEGDATYELVTTSSGQVRIAGTLRKHMWHGVHKQYYPNGNPQMEVPYQRGVPDGTVRQWSPDGQVREREVRDGKPVPSSQKPKSV
jgi:hypothetical protein